MVTSPTPLHSAYHPLTRREIEMIDQAFGKLLTEHPDGVPVKEIVAELVRMGIPTAERAQLAVEMSTHPGGPPGTVLGMLIAMHQAKLSTPELAALIEHHLPGTPTRDIIAELTRQGEAARAKAEEIVAHLDVHPA